MISTSVFACYELLCSEIGQVFVKMNDFEAEGSESSKKDEEEEVSTLFCFNSTNECELNALLGYSPCGTYGWPTLLYCVKTSHSSTKFTQKLAESVAREGSQDSIFQTGFRHVSCAYEFSCMIFRLLCKIHGTGNCLPTNSNYFALIPQIVLIYISLVRPSFYYGNF